MDITVKYQFNRPRSNTQLSPESLADNTVLCATCLHRIVVRLYISGKYTRKKETLRYIVCSTWLTV